jgi:predicted ribosomally synthesized peptide with nif11-like leader
MSNIIKNLLQDAQVRQQIEAANQAEAMQLLVAAGKQKGYAFTQQELADAIHQVQNPELELSDAALEAVAGGLPAQSCNTKCAKECLGI